MSNEEFIPGRELLCTLKWSVTQQFTANSKQHTPYYGVHDQIRTSQSCHHFCLQFFAFAELLLLAPDQSLFQYFDPQQWPSCVLAVKKDEFRILTPTSRTPCCVHQYLFTSSADWKSQQSKMKVLPMDRMDVNRQWKLHQRMEVPSNDRMEVPSNDRKQVTVIDSAEWKTNQLTE